MKAKSIFKTTTWKEEPIGEPDHKMTRVSTGFDITGDLVADAEVEYLMFYSQKDANDMHKSVAAYVGLIRIEGKLHGKSGSFVVEDKGTFEAGSARSILTIIPESGTGELNGITGTGRYVASQTEVLCEFDYNL